MNKAILLTSDSGHVYSIPAEVVAEARAKHYSDDPDSSYQEEYEYTLSSDYELSDWLHGNMNWEDVMAFASLVGSPERDTPILGQCETEIVEVAPERVGAVVTPEQEGK